MEPFTIAVVCVVGFGVIGLLAAFIRQLLLSRDKRLNDEAQKKAISQEAKELEKIREQMANPKRFDSHYQVLGENKEAIRYIDQKIEAILKRKEELVMRYSDLILKESNSIVSGESGQERKGNCDRLKEEIDSEIKFYNKELENLQQHRAALWDNHTDVQDYLIDHEKQRNENMDSLFKHHSDLLEKIYLRHNQNTETVATKTIDAGTDTYKSAFMIPVNFILGLFGLSKNIDPTQAGREKAQREKVQETQTDINSVEDPQLPPELDSDEETWEEYRKNVDESVI